MDESIFSNSRDWQFRDEFRDSFSIEYFQKINI